MTITDKIQELLQQKDNQVETLKKQRNEEIYNSIKKIDDFYEEKINILNYEKNKIMNLKYLDANDSIDAILYLVNKIEDKEYKKIVVPIKYKGIYLTKNKEETLINEFNVVGLTNDENFPQIEKYGTYNEQNLNIPFVNFFKLAHYNKKFEKSLKINYLNDSYPKYCNNMSSNVDSFISDHRFLYIKDYIRKLIDYRLENENYKITLAEMITIADQFVDEYMDSKKLVKDIK